MIARAVVVVLAAAGSAPALAAQNPSSARVALDRAGAWLERGMADSAVAGYRDAIAWAAGARGIAAEAYFGLATAQGGTAEAEDASRIEAFLEAARLDSARYFVAGHNNAAQVARLRGDHGTSAALYRTAGRGRHPARSYILLDAGKEWLQAREGDSALAALRAAVAADPGNAGAVATLARVAEERGRPDLVLELATRTGDTDASVQELVADALVGAMAGPSSSTALCDTALMLLAPALIRMNAGPDVFDFRFRPGLVEASAVWHHAGVGALIDAYRGPPQRTDPPAWWRDRDDRRALWARTMTALGTRHDVQGAPVVARRYYEAALGFPHTLIEVPWLDLEALLPLARLYADLPTPEFQVFQRWAFEEKGNMYELLRSNAPAAVPILRRLHLSLGVLFAKRKAWGRGTDDIFGAAFQLSRMREFTQRMRADGAKVSDPPEALEYLVYALWAVGRRDEALRLAPQVVTLYRQRGDRSRALRLEQAAGSPARMDDVVGGR